MKVIKFTTGYEPVLQFTDKDFKKKYEERVGDNESYRAYIDSELKHLAVCPKCNNPVAILGVYKKIDQSPHARHAKKVNMDGVAYYNEDKYLHCPYHRKHADYIKEYVPEKEIPQRQELYRIARDHFDKAVYLLEKTTGIYINPLFAEDLARNYAAVRAYNYIDATNYNIPWYLLYSFTGFSLYHKLIKKESRLYRELRALDIKLVKSRREGYVFVEKNNDEGYFPYALCATNYRYSVNKDDELSEHLDFSILEADDPKDMQVPRLFHPLKRFSISVDSYHFGNLIGYSKWKTNEELLEIARKCML